MGWTVSWWNSSRVSGHGEGFCVFNDIACAVRVAQRDYKELFEGEERTC